MSLKEYLDNAPRGTAARLAKTLGVRPVNVSLWANGRRAVPIMWCPEIQKFTDGKVTCRDLRPHDYEKIWPDLAGS